MLHSQMVSFSLSFGPSVSLGCLLNLCFLKALLDPNFFPIFVGHSSQTMLLWFLVVCCLNILLFLKVFPHIKQEYLIGSSLCCLVMCTVYTLCWSVGDSFVGQSFVFIALPLKIIDAEMALYHILSYYIAALCLIPRHPNSAVYDTEQ